MRLSSLLTLAVLMLGGCTTVRTEFVPPASEQGRMCLTQCGATKERCVGHQQRQAESERFSCEDRRENEYRACLHQAGRDRDRQHECDKKRHYCSTYVSTTRCESDYELCYANCGGKVIKTEEK